MSEQEQNSEQIIEARSLALSKVIQSVRAVADRIGKDDASQLHEAMKEMLALEYPPPSLGHNEVSGDELRRRGWGMVRLVLNPAVESIHRMLHMSEILKSGDQWTMTLGSDCGFSGRMILQVDSLGKCAGEDDERIKNPLAEGKSEDRGDEGVPPDDGKLPEVSDVNDYLRQMGWIPKQED